MYRLLIIITLLIGANNILFCDDYIPLTRAEARKYIDKSSKEQLIDDIIKLDLLEHTTPVIPDPNYSALLLDDGSLIIFPESQTALMTYAYLSFNINFETYHIDNFYNKKDKLFTKIIIGVSFFIIGYIAGYIFK